MGRLLGYDRFLHVVLIPFAKYRQLQTVETHENTDHRRLPGYVYLRLDFRLYQLVELRGAAYVRLSVYLLLRRMATIMFLE